MRAIRFLAHGGPDVLHCEDLPAPKPQAGEVIVRLQARGINRAEILTVQGIYPRRPDLPAIPGREGAGIVEALGDGVSSWQVGDRVVLRVGAAVGSGTWCEQVRVRADNLLPKPETLDMNQAGGMMVSYLTAYISLIEVLQLKAKDSLIVTAASSPTGLATLQLCRHLGIQSFATTRREERRQALLEAGASLVVVDGRDDLISVVRHATGGEGASAAFDAVSGDLGRACFKAIREGGTVLQYGALSLGPLIANPGTLIFKQKHIQGFWLTRVLEQWPREQVDAIYEGLLDLCLDGSVGPLVHRSYDLAEAGEALREMNRMVHLGKVVLTSD